jgi:hypothetical protein
VNSITVAGSAIRDPRSAIRKQTNKPIPIRFWRIADNNGLRSVGIGSGEQHHRCGFRYPRSAIRKQPNKADSDQFLADRGSRIADSERETPTRK